MAKLARNKSIYSQFVGALTKDGKKNLAKRIVDEAFFSASKTLKIPPQMVLVETFKKLNSLVEIKKVKLGGSIHIVPFAISFKRRTYLVVKWVLDAVREDKRRVPFSEKLTFELVNTVKGAASKSMKAKEANTELAMVNRANIHYRW